MAVGVKFQSCIQLALSPTATVYCSVLVLGLLAPARKMLATRSKKNVHYQRQEKENVQQNNWFCSTYKLTKAADETYTLNEKSKLKRLFYETTDSIKNAARSRFEQADLHVLKARKDLFLVQIIKTQYLRIWRNIW